MSKYRQAAKIDSNQPAIVEDLRKLGFSVQAGMDDLLIGGFGRTFWYEIKTEDCRSKKTGEILQSAKKASQIILEETWRGHYKIVTSTEEILADIREQMK